MKKHFCIGGVRDYENWLRHESNENTGKYCQNKRFSELWKLTKCLQQQRAFIQEKWLDRNTKSELWAVVTCTIPIPTLFRSMVDLKPEVQTQRFFLNFFFIFSITLDIQHFISFGYRAWWLDIYITYKVIPQEV